MYRNRSEPQASCSQWPFEGRWTCDGSNYAMERLSMRVGGASGGSTNCAGLIIGLAVNVALASGLTGGCHQAVFFR
jgi:hypothetical protein